MNNSASPSITAHDPPIDFGRLQCTGINAEHIFLHTEAGFQLGSPYDAQVFHDGLKLYSLRELDQQADRAPADWHSQRELLLSALNQECTHLSQQLTIPLRERFPIGPIISDLQITRAQAQALSDLAKSAAPSPEIQDAETQVAGTAQIIKAIKSYATEELSILRPVLSPRTLEIVRLLTSDSIYLTESPTWVTSDRTNCIDFNEPLFIKNGVNGGLGLVQVSGMRHYKLTLGVAIELAGEYQRDPAFASEYGAAIRKRRETLVVECTDAAYRWAKNNQQEIVDLVESQARAVQKAGKQQFSALSELIDLRMDSDFQRERARSLKLAGESDFRKADLRARIDHELAVEVKKMFGHLELEAIHIEIANKAQELKNAIRLNFLLPATDVEVHELDSDALATIGLRRLDNSGSQTLDLGLVQAQELQQFFDEYGIDVNASSDVHAALWISGMVDALIPHELAHLLVDNYRGTVEGEVAQFENTHSELIETQIPEGDDREFLNTCIEEAIIDGIGAQISTSSLKDRAAALTSVMTFLSSRYQPRFYSGDLGELQRFAIGLRLCAHADALSHDQPELGQLAQDFEGRKLSEARQDLYQLCSELRERSGVSEELQTALLETYQAAFRAGGAVDLNQHRRR